MGRHWAGPAGYDATLDGDALLHRVYSMPWDAPLVPPFPIGFRNLSIMTLCYRTTPAAVRRLLPPPLTPVGDVVLMHVYDMPDVDFVGSVRECNVMVGAELRRDGGVAQGGFSVHQYLDSDMGVAQGREVHGQPKKLAALSLQTHGDLMVARVERNTIPIITGTLPYKQRRCGIDAISRHFDFALNVNLKMIPHIDGTPAIRQLTSRRLMDLEVHECWTGPCTVELHPNAQAPVWRLPVVEPLDGFFWRASFTLVEGEILLDYLQRPEAARGA